MLLLPTLIFVRHWNSVKLRDDRIAQTRSEVVHVQVVGRDQFLAAELEGLIGKTHAEAGISDAILSYNALFSYHEDPTYSFLSSTDANSSALFL